MEVECDDQFLDTEEEEDDDKFRNIHEQWITKSQQILELKAEGNRLHALQSLLKVTFNLHSGQVEGWTLDSS